MRGGVGKVPGVGDEHPIGDRKRQRSAHQGRRQHAESLPGTRLESCCGSYRHQRILH